MKLKPRWIKPLARAGYASRGIIYTVIGFFAVLAAIGAGRPMDSEQALYEVLSGTWGGLLTYLLVVGLVSYALWRAIQAAFDTDRHGTNFKGVAVRGGLMVSALVYLTLATYALSLRGYRGSGGSGSGEGFAGILAGLVGSSWAALLIAAVLTVVGVAHFVKAIVERYAKHLQATARAMRVIHPIAKVGLIARGVVFLTVAFLFALRVGRAGESSGTPNTRDALEYLQSLPGGGYLLTAAGIGLLSFALYSYVEAVFRRINVEEAVRPI